MNAEELKAHVSVQVFKGSFRVNYWEPDFKIQRRVAASIRNFSGSAKQTFLLADFYFSSFEGDCSKMTLDQKITQFEKEHAEHTARLNKMLAGLDPNRATRFWDKKNELLRTITMGKYHIERLEQEAKPIREQVAKAEQELKQLESDHVNNLDHCFMYSDLKPKEKQPCKQ